MIHTPACRLTGLPIIVCCRYLAKTLRENIKVPTTPVCEPVSVLLCRGATPVADDVVNATEVGIVANNKVTVLNYRFSPTCTQFLHDIPPSGYQ